MRFINGENNVRQSQQNFEQIYKVVYDGLIWILRRSGLNLTSYVKSDMKLEKILQIVLKKNRTDGAFQIKAKQVLLALGRLQLTTFQQQNLLQQMLSVFHKVNTLHIQALRRKKWQDYRLQGTFDCFDQAFDETQRFLDLVGEAIQVRYLLNQNINRPLCIFYDEEGGGIFMSTRCNLQQKIDYRSQFLAQNQEMIYEMGELVKKESKTLSHNLELLERRIDFCTGYKNTELH